jgi:hypothetical protein
MESRLLLAIFIMVDNRFLFGFCFGDGGTEYSSNQVMS